jgi:hypothetical protein
MVQEAGGANASREGNRYSAIMLPRGDFEAWKTMTVESIPNFTEPAAKLWEALPAATRKMLLSNVWYGKCRHEVTITNFSGSVKEGNLLLGGSCSECHGDVARLIE